MSVTMSFPSAGHPSRVRVKICGITRVEDAVLAVEAGADMIGMIFYPPSPRYVSLARAQAIVQAVRERSPRVRVVAVTVNAPTWLLQVLLDEVGVDWIQCHGDEPREQVAALKGRGFKAVRLTGTTLAESASFLGIGPRDGPRLLVDAAVPGAYGGTGRQADWTAARELARQGPILLAGGLTPDNVANAVQYVQPWGVDVSSGVETRPGQKDPARVRAFIARAWAATQEVQGDE